MRRKIGFTLTAIIVLLVTYSQGRIYAQDQIQRDQLKTKKTDSDSTQSVRIKNRFVDVPDAVPTIESEPITGKDTVLRATNAGAAKSIDSAATIPEFKAISVAKAKNPLNQQLANGSKKSSVEHETNQTHLDSTTDQDGTNRDIESESTPFQSPNLFTVQAKPTQNKKDQSFGLNPPKLTADISEPTLEPEISSSKDGFLSLHSIKTKIAEGAANTKMSEAYIPSTTDHDIFIEIGRAHRRISQSVKYQFGDEAVQFSSFQDQDGQDTEQQSVDEWTQQLRKPIDSQILSRAVKIGSKEQNAIPKDYTKEMDYGLTASFAPAIRSTNEEAWQHRSKLWEAPNFYHRPLYFEETNLERYGHVQRFQSARSAAHFFGRIPVLPYMTGIRLPNERVYSKGHYRHGSCNPAFAQDIPVNRRALLFQSLATTGAIIIFP